MMMKKFLACLLLAIGVSAGAQTAMQNVYGRKGLVDEHGNRKQAFYIMQDFYNSPGR